MTLMWHLEASAENVRRGTKTGHYWVGHGTIGVDKKRYPQRPVGIKVTGLVGVNCSNNTNLERTNLQEDRGAIRLPRLFNGNNFYACAARPKSQRLRFSCSVERGAHEGAT
jgi:hypothetical protein